MSEQNNDPNEIVSIIYQTRNDSPKHLSVQRKNFLLFFVGLPLLTIIGLSLGIIGLIHTSPFHLIQNYQKNQEAREAIRQTNGLRENLRKSLEENLTLKQELAKANAPTTSPDPKSPTSNDKTLNNCPATPICPNPKEMAPMTNSIGLSTLSFFKPIQLQKDKTRPASLSLNDFKVQNGRDTINFQFNIVNLLGGDVKLAGHIIVLMKNDQMIEVYPINALNSPNETQISYTSGEPFATQRFRPVDASFPKPRKSGNSVFTVYIFAKNGDLIHYQSVNLAVRI